MQITLNVDENLFNESGVGLAIKEAFDSMPEEEKRSIVTDIVRQRLTESEVVKRYFIEGSYRYSGDKPRPTYEFSKIIGSIDFSKELESAKTQILGFVSEPQPDLIAEMIVRAFIKNLADCLSEDATFKGALTERIVSLGNSMFERKK